MHKATWSCSNKAQRRLRVMLANETNRAFFPLSKIRIPFRLTAE